MASIHGPFAGIADHNCGERGVVRQSISREKMCRSADPPPHPARTTVGALWAAVDPGGTFYLYAKHLSPDAEPSQNTNAIKQLGIGHRV